MNFEKIPAQAKNETQDATAEIAQEAMGQFTNEQLDGMIADATDLENTIKNAPQDKLQEELKNSKAASVLFKVMAFISGGVTIGAGAMYEFTQTTLASGDMQNSAENFWSRTASLAVVSTFLSICGAAWKMNDMDKTEKKMRRASI